MLKSIKVKQKMYRTHFLNNNARKVEEYKKYSNTNKLKQQCKIKYFSQQITINKYNLKNTWKLIWTLIKRNTKSQTTPTMQVNTQ